MQSKYHSFLESLANILIGYFVALASQLIIFPFYGINISLPENIAIGVWFTIISVIRSYALRRWFNKQIIVPIIDDEDLPEFLKRQSN